MTVPSHAQVGVTGLAVMGRNLARNFARHGYRVAVHNRTEARTRSLVDEFGTEGSSSPPGPPSSSSPHWNAPG